MALRHNNQTMVGLRNAVYEADKSNGDVEKALDNLRSYVYGHMNTDLTSGGNAIKPPIQLKYTYDRLEAAENKRVGDINAKLYPDAQVYCEQQNSTAFSGRIREPCIADYVSTHGAKANPIPPALYQFDFASPSWSPDLAGWTLLTTLFFFAAFVIKILADQLTGLKSLYK